MQILDVAEEGQDRAFAKLQMDEEAAIRTNTTICLGKLAAPEPSPQP